MVWTKVTPYSLKRWALVGIYVRFLWLFPCFDEIYSAAFYWQTLSRLNGSWSCISWTRCKTRRFSPMRPFGIWGKRFQVHFFQVLKFFLGSFLGGGIQILFIFTTYLGKISNLTDIFQRGWNHHPVLNDQRLLKTAPTQLPLLCFFSSLVWDHLSCYSAGLCQRISSEQSQRTEGGVGVDDWKFPPPFFSNFPTFRLGTQHRALCQFERERNQVGRCVGIKWKK